MGVGKTERIKTCGKKDVWLSTKAKSWRKHVCDISGTRPDNCCVCLVESTLDEFRHSGGARKVVGFKAVLATDAAVEA